MRGKVVHMYISYMWARVHALLESRVNTYYETCQLRESAMPWGHAPPEKFMKQTTNIKKQGLQ